MIITISRKFGSGGRELGKRLSEALQIPYYDHTIIEMISKENGLDSDYVARISESDLQVAYPPTIGRRFSIPYKVMEQSIMVAVTQQKVVEKLAQQGDCVIVGRCADYILKDMDNVVNVFIWADIDFRIERAIRIDGLSPNKAAENILKIDKRRANYYNYHASEKWGRAENYHLAVKSSYGGIDHAVACIKAYIEGSGD